jgi:predicted  nucleic acid-binding Zn-ribbon protein
MLKRRRTPLEDSDLEFMVKRDELQSERGRLEAEIADISKGADVVRSRIAEATAAIDQERAAEQAKRDALVPRVPTDVLEQYESIRETKKGIGVGALRDGVCTACREALSAVEVDRMKRKAREGERLFRCEHCRRLLVVE